MYLPAKVLEVIMEGKDVEGYDSSVVHALVEAWDENELLVVVQPNLNAKIKKGDFTIMEMNNPSPGMTRFIIIKILKGAIAKTVWKSYKDKLAKLKEQSKQASVPRIMPQQFDVPELKSNMIG